jgi:hypothetical protein
MSWDVKFAKLLQERDNLRSIGVVLGTVLAESPLTVGILDNQVQLHTGNCFIMDSLALKSAEIVAGDKVLVIASEDNQTFFIVDKVVRP